MISSLDSLSPYMIFISHSWSSSDSYNRLTTLLNNKLGFNYRNLSVPKEDPIHHAPNDMVLFQAIKNRIDQCDIVLILAGVYASHSKWINLEINAAQRSSQGLLGTLATHQTWYKSGKPILAIEEWGAQRTSHTVKDNADAIAGWNTDAIVSSIRNLVRK